jgi:hypothetical protein
MLELYAKSHVSSLQRLLALRSYSFLLSVHESVGVKSLCNRRMRGVEAFSNYRSAWIERGWLPLKDSPHVQVLGECKEDRRHRRVPCHSVSWAAMTPIPQSNISDAGAEAGSAMAEIRTSGHLLCQEHVSLVLHSGACPTKAVGKGHSLKVSLLR